MTVDPTNRASIRKAEKAARAAERERKEVIVNLMNSASGRRYIYDKLTEASIFQTTFSTNALQMAFNEGNRNTGLKLLNDLMQHCPDQYILMMREANARSTAAEYDRGPNGDGRDQGRDDDYDPTGYRPSL